MIKEHTNKLGGPNADVMKRIETLKKPKLVQSQGMTNHPQLDRIADMLRARKRSEAEAVVAAAILDLINAMKIQSIPPADILEVVKAALRKMSGPDATVRTTVKDDGAVQFDSI